MNQFLRRGRLRLRGVAAIAVLWVAGGPVTPASAQVKPAEAHYKTGQAYYQRGAYADAIREFERAYKLSMRSELLYNIGQTYERLGDLQRAVAYLARYLKKSGTSNEALAQKIENLRRRLEQTGVRIKCQVAGAAVIVDGKAVGTTPLAKAIHLQPGQHQVQVTKSGYAPYSLAVSVTAGTVVDVDVSIEPVKAVSATTSEAGGASASATAAPATAAPATSATATRPVKGRKRLWTWITLGTASALLIGGAVTGGLALDKAASSSTGSDAEADSAKTFGAVTDGLLIAGTAVAITGVVLFFFEGSEAGEHRGTAKSSVVPTLGPGYAGLSAAFDF